MFPKALPFVLLELQRLIPRQSSGERYFPFQAIDPFSYCFRCVSTTAPPLLHSHCRNFIATTQDPDFSNSRMSLLLCGSCAPRWKFPSTIRDLPSSPAFPSQHAITADTARTLESL